MASCTSPRELVDHRLGVLGVVLDGVAGEAELHGEGHEVLLGAVVQVPLELAALGVGGGHDAGPRLLQLVVAQPQLVEAGLERRVELHVVQRQADLAGQLGEHAVLGFGERLAVGAAAGDDEAEQLAAVGDGRHPDGRHALGPDDARQPDAEPRAAADAGAGHDRSLLGADLDRRPAGGGGRRRRSS